MDLNGIDLFLIGLIALGSFLGGQRGFLLEFSDLVAWATGLFSGIWLYQPAAQWLKSATGWPGIWNRPISFLLVFFLVFFLVRIAAVKLMSAVPQAVHLHPGNKVLGVLPGAVSGFIYAIASAVILIALPLPVEVQNEAKNSAVHNRLIGYAEAFESQLRPIFDDAIGETFNRLAVRPQTNQMVKLPFSVKESRPREMLESQMLELVNAERKKAGLNPLIMDKKLIRTARKHSEDMLARGYFSHYSPEGKNAFDRMRADKVPFLVAGENLAFAPTVGIAHAGLMNSPGHRANILRPQFGKVGIGVMDAGARGIMVTQKFSN